jgi:hypothetical protein
MNKVLILQPGYIPWLGFFDKFKNSNIYVVYDNVQYCKNDFFNRNRIRAGSDAIWLTIPVHASGFPAINQVCIDNRNNWTRKHLRSIELNYNKAPYFDLYWPTIEHLLSKQWELLIDVQMAFIRQMLLWFNLHPQILLASELPVSQSDRNLKLVEICQMLGADTYISGMGAQCYLDESLFKAAGIQVIWLEWHETPYPQLGKGFISNLSALDLLMNCGGTSSYF